MPYVYTAVGGNRALRHKVVHTYPDNCRTNVGADDMIDRAMDHIPITLRRRASKGRFSPARKRQTYIKLKCISFTPGKTPKLSAFASACKD